MQRPEWKPWVISIDICCTWLLIVLILTMTSQPVEAVPLISRSFFAAATTSYGSLEAMTILLREGLEGLLVVAALLSFLNKSGQAHQQGWIWAGAVGGIGASVITGLLIKTAFTSMFRDLDPEFLEGITGVIAATLLIYVSYWLHRQGSIGQWQRYLREQATEALATNRLLSLALIAFLAIYREGAETVLFYLGIAPAISVSDLCVGLGLGTALLGVLALLIIWIGIKIPLKPFFSLITVLIYGFGFKLVGTAIHAFQKAGVLSVHPVSPSLQLKLLGIYPTWETLLPQILLVIIATAILYQSQGQSQTQPENLKT